MSHATHDAFQAAASTDELTETERHRLLEADRRRHAVAVIGDRSDPVDLQALAEAVAAREDPVDADDAEAVSTVATTLHHVHLPKMADVGLVDYDAEANRIRP